MINILKQISVLLLFLLVFLGCGQSNSSKPKEEIVESKIANLNKTSVKGDSILLSLAPEVQQTLLYQISESYGNLSQTQEIADYWSSLKVKKQTDGFRKIDMLLGHSEPPILNYTALFEEDNQKVIAAYEIDNRGRLLSQKINQPGREVHSSTIFSYNKKGYIKDSSKEGKFIIKRKDNEIYFTSPKNATIPSSKKIVREKNKISTYFQMRENPLKFQKYFVFDDQGQVEEFYSEQGSITLKRNYTYRDDGRIKYKREEDTRVDAQKNETKSALHSNYFYNSNKLLTKVENRINEEPMPSSWSEQSYTFSKDDQGRVNLKIDYFEDGRLEKPASTTNYTFDEKGNWIFKQSIVKGLGNQAQARVLTY